MAVGFVEAWDESAARNVLESLIRANGGQVVRPMTMTAALAVSDDLHSVARFAALRLMGLDGKPRRPPAGLDAGAVKPARSVTLDETLYDAARLVTDLALNGGLDHAYEMVGDRFAVAASACELVGAPEAGRVLLDLLALVGIRGSVSRSRTGLPNWPRSGMTTSNVSMRW